MWRQWTPAETGPYHQAPPARGVPSVRAVHARRSRRWPAVIISVAGLRCSTADRRLSGLRTEVRAGRQPARPGEVSGFRAKRRVVSAPNTCQAGRGSRPVADR
jgi:hypothetical protein